MKTLLWIDPKIYGFEYALNPRPEIVTAGALAEAGVAALSGEKGHIYDRILLNAAMVDYLLGICPDPHDAIKRTKSVMDDGSALRHLQAYIVASREL